MSVLEIRRYTIKPDMAAQFGRIMRSESLPLLNATGTNVVAFLPSLHAPDAFVLMRTYRSLAHRNASQDSFYGSRAWRDGPRQSVLDCIDVFTNAIIEIDDALLNYLHCAKPQEGTL